MLEALKTILPCIVFASKQGVPLGTRMQESSFFPSSRFPVTAWTTQTLLISVAELVIKIFEPLMTHSSPSKVAVVLEAPASEPALGSVNPKEERAFPVQSSGSHFFFCSSFPYELIGKIPSEFPAARVAAWEPSTRAIYSVAMI